MKHTPSVTLYSFALAVVAAGLALLTISDRSHIGVVQSREGLVMAVTEEEKRPLEREDKVYAHETLVTGAMSKVQVMFGDGTVLALDENTMIELSDFAYEAMERDKRWLDFKVLTGTCRFLTGQITKHNPDGFKLETPLGSIGIRGTEGIITVTPANAAAFFAALNDALVRGGYPPLPSSYLEALVAHINGLTTREMTFTTTDGKTIVIPRGFLVTISGTGQPGELREIGPQDKESFDKTGFQKHAHIPPAFSVHFSGYVSGPSSVGATPGGRNAGDGAQQEAQSGGGGGGTGGGGRTGQASVGE